MVISCISRLYLFALLKFEVWISLQFLSLISYFLKAYFHDPMYECFLVAEFV